MKARTVLVTRPAGQGVGLVQALERSGLRAVSLPLLELRALEGLSDRQQELLAALDEYQHIVFISSNAVRFGMAWINKYWPRPPAGLSWYAVGAATAARLAEFGIEALTPGDDMSSEGLLRLQQLQQLAHQQVVIVKGEGGRNLLRSALLQRGAQVAELACYRRCRPSLAAGELLARLRTERVELVLISSAEGLANMVALADSTGLTGLPDMVLVVPSRRVAETARGMGFERVLVADNATDAAMLAAAQQWRAGGA